MPDPAAAAADVLDAIDSGCTPDEVRATAEWAHGEAQRAQAIPRRVLLGMALA